MLDADQHRDVAVVTVARPFRRLRLYVDSRCKTGHSEAATRNPYPGLTRSATRRDPGSEVSPTFDKFPGRTRL